MARSAAPTPVEKIRTEANGNVNLGWPRILFTYTLSLRVSGRAPATWRTSHWPVTSASAGPQAPQATVERVRGAESRITRCFAERRHRRNPCPEKWRHFAGPFSMLKNGTLLGNTPPRSTFKSRGSVVRSRPAFETQNRVRKMAPGIQNL